MVSRYHKGYAVTPALRGRESHPHEDTVVKGLLTFAPHPLHSRVVSGKRVALNRSVDMADRCQGWVELSRARSRCLRVDKDHLQVIAGREAGLPSSSDGRSVLIYVDWLPPDLSFVAEAASP